MKKNLHVLILCTFGIVYCLISLVNHYNFRTYGCDLGIFNHALYQYAHFRSSGHPIFHNLFSNFLGDHFSFYEIILSPLFWLWGSYTLLIVQVLSTLFGAYGIYTFFKARTIKPYLPEIAMLHYLSFFGIFSAIGSDYHDNVTATALVPWFFHFFSCGKRKHTLVFFILILISKENVALWMSFLCLGLLLINYRNKRNRNLAAILSVIALAYAVIAINVIMPAIDEKVARQGYHHFKYSILGSGFTQILQNILTKPFTLLKYLFFSHIPPTGTGIKRELHLVLLLSGAWVLIIKPAYLVMLLPVYAQKLFSDDSGIWGIHGHHNAEFIPVISIALFQWISDLKSRLPAYIIAVNAATLSATTTFIFKTEGHTVSPSWYDPVPFQFYHPIHYTCDFNRDAIFKGMSVIPPDAAVSTQEHLIPRLAFRDKIYEISDPHDAQYIILAASRNNPAICDAAYLSDIEKKIAEFQRSDQWEMIFSEGKVFVFRKKP